MQEIVGVGGGGSREQLDGGVYFFLVSRAFAPHARNNSGTTGGVELADMFPSVTWRKTPMEHRRRSQLQPAVARGARYRALGRNANNIVASSE